MSEPMTDKELQSFYEYAGANMVEPDGSQCQWADYSMRCVDEIRRLRKRYYRASAFLEKVYLTDIHLSREIRNFLDEGEK